MENELLDLKSAKLRLEKEAAAATGRAAKAEAALGALSKRSQDDREELGRLVAERRLTMARLMQAEAKVRVLSDKAPPGVCSRLSMDTAYPEHVLTEWMCVCCSKLSQQSCCYKTAG